MSKTLFIDANSKETMEKATDLAMKIGKHMNGLPADVCMLALQSVWDLLTKMVNEEK